MNIWFPRYVQHENLPKKTSAKIHKYASNNSLDHLEHLNVGIWMFSIECILPLDKQVK